MTDFESNVASVCVTCGADCDFPAKADVERALEVRPDGSFFADVKTPCPRCGATRLRISVTVGMG